MPECTETSGFQAALGIWRVLIPNIWDATGRPDGRGFHPSSDSATVPWFSFWFYICDFCLKFCKEKKIWTLGKVQKLLVQIKPLTHRWGSSCLVTQSDLPKIAKLLGKGVGARSPLLSLLSGAEYREVLCWEAERKWNIGKCTVFPSFWDAE